MDHTRVNQEIKFLSTNGVTLNPDEKMNLSLALQTLQCEFNFEELLLWGKINGKCLFFSRPDHETVTFISNRLLDRLLCGRWPQLPGQTGVRLPTVLLVHWRQLEVL